MVSVKSEQNKARVLLDTNILVYASDSNNDYNKICLRLLQQEYDFYISDRCLLELYRVLTGPKKLSVDQTLSVIEFYTDNPKFAIIYDTSNTSLITFELARQTQAISGKIFDLNILAIAIENEIDYIATKKIKDYPIQQAVKIVDPKELSK